MLEYLQNALGTQGMISLAQLSQFCAKIAVQCLGMLRNVQDGSTMFSYLSRGQDNELS